MRSTDDIVVVGDRWDRADAMAAADRARAIHRMLLSPAVAAERDDQLPMRPLGDEIVEDRVRTTRHEDGTGATILVTREPVAVTTRSALHVRIERHPHVKDMTLSIRYDDLIMPEPAARDMVGSVADALSRYETDLEREGRGCHRHASTTMNDVMRMLVERCRMRWGRGGQVPMRILNIACPTPWTGATDCVGDPNGGGTHRFLSEEARLLVEGLLPTAMTADWTDMREKGTGRVTSRLSMGPLGAVGMTSAQAGTDPIAHLRDLERLRLPNDGILDAP